MNRKIITIIVCFFIFFLITSSSGYSETDDHFRFAVIGCMHFGLGDPEDYKLAVEKIKEYSPDFVLFLGSMVDTVGEKADREGYKYSTAKAFKEGTKLSSAAVESLWEEFDRITDKLGVPVYDVPSERCIPANNLAVTEMSFLKRYKDRYYSFEHKNNLFICLDSESHNRTDLRIRGLIDGSQLDFLKNSLVDTSKYNNVFIAMHRSVGFAGFGGDSKWRDIVHPLIDKKVKYVFGACQHRLDTRKIDDVNYVITGGPPCWLSPKAKPSFFHFLIVDVDKEEVSIKVVPVESTLPIENLVNSEKKKSGGLYPSIRNWSLERFDGVDGQYSSDKTHSLERIERVTLLQPARIIETLKIKPGMNILDIGAGRGFFTFPFAESLKGGGKVFATDSNPGMIENIKWKMEEGKYKNIVPVLVKSEGLDPFYKQHSFDIIFLCGIYEYLRNPEDYLRQLRSSLAKETGRLFIVYFRNDSDFHEVEFDDFKKVIEVLISKGEDFPVFQKLDKQTQDFIKYWQDEDVPPEIQVKIIKSFNKILSDRLFFNELSDYYPTSEEIKLHIELWRIVHPDDFRLAKWLIASLDENDVFNRQRKVISDIDKRQLRRLNRILLSGIFQTQRLYELHSANPPTYLEKDSVMSTLEAAGYRFVREHDFLVHNYFLEFIREY